LNVKSSIGSAPMDLKNEKKDLAEVQVRTTQVLKKELKSIRLVS